jgi:hypothetical protein
MFRRNILSLSSGLTLILKVVALRSDKTLVFTYNSARRRSPQDQYRQHESIYSAMSSMKNKNEDNCSLFLESYEVL